MPETLPDPTPAAARHRRSLAGFVAVMALGALIVIAYQASRQPPETALPGEVMLAGGGTLIIAFAVWMRMSGVMGVLEAIWDAVCALASAIGAVLAAIWNGFLSLIGWD